MTVTGSADETNEDGKQWRLSKDYKLDGRKEKL